jgi:hypothetical protein
MGVSSFAPRELCLNSDTHAAQWISVAGGFFWRAVAQPRALPSASRCIVMGPHVGVVVRPQGMHGEKLGDRSDAGFVRDGRKAADAAFVSVRSRMLVDRSVDKRAGLLAALTRQQWRVIWTRASVCHVPGALPDHRRGGQVRALSPRIQQRSATKVSPVDRWAFVLRRSSARVAQAHTVATPSDMSLPCLLGQDSHLAYLVPRRGCDVGWRSHVEPMGWQDARL